MKNIIITISTLFVLFGCNNNSTSSSNNNTPTTPTNTANLCSDSNASNKGYALPCICNSGYSPNSNATACIYNTPTNTNLPPANLSYIPNPLTLYVGTYISNPYTPTVQNCTTANPCNFSLVSGGNLPVGITINSATGAISGLPSAQKNAQTYIIKATNQYGSTTASLSMQVIYRPPSGLQLTNSAASYLINQSITTNSISYDSGYGSVISMSVSPTLPTGLFLQMTGDKQWSILGTPSVASPLQTYTLTATGADGSTTINTTFTIEVLTPITTITYQNTPECSMLNNYYTCSFTFGQSFTDLIPVVNTTGASFRIASNSTNSQFPSGISMSPTSGKIGTSSFGPFETTDTLCGGAEYCVYKIEAYNSLGSASTTVRIKVNPAPAPTSIQYAQSTYLYRTLTVIQDMTLTFTGGTPNCYGLVNCFTISPALPSGLSISTTTGKISGSPDIIAKQAPKQYIVTAHDSRTSGINSVPFTIEVKERLPIIKYAQNGDYVFNKQINIESGGFPRLDTSDGSSNALCGNNGIPVSSFSISPALPSGLSLNTGAFICGNLTSGGSITGTPLSLYSKTTHTITACNDGGCVNTNINIEVAPYIMTILGGESHACAITQDLITNPASLICWGSNKFGQLGNTGSSTCAESNCSLSAKYALDSSNNPLTNVMTASTGKNHTCSIIKTATDATYGSMGKVVCWGDNSVGQLGDGSNISKSVPTQVLKADNSALDQAFSIASGGNNTCVITMTSGISTGDLPGAVYCFGEMYGNKAVRIGNVNSNVTQNFLASSLKVGESHACAIPLVMAIDSVSGDAVIDSNDSVACWGKNNKGQLGNGTTSLNTTLTPTAVIYNSSNISGIDYLIAGGNHTCAYTLASTNYPNGQLLCWGDNTYGQVDGKGISPLFYNPTNVYDATGTILTSVLKVGAGYNYSLAHENSTNQLLNFGQIPYANANYSASSTATMILMQYGAGLSQFISGSHPIIAPSAKNFGCDMLSYNGLIHCWGNNDFGQLGNGTNTSVELPTRLYISY